MLSCTPALPEVPDALPLPDVLLLPDAPLFLDAVPSEIPAPAAEDCMAEVKLSDDFTSIFLLAVFCGMLMFIAVDCFRNVQGSTLRFIGVFVPVMVFILSGFEHVIANMFYFSLSGTWSAHCFVAVLVMTLGNAVGGMLIPIYLKVFKQR